MTIRDATRQTFSEDKIFRNEILKEFTLDSVNLIALHNLVHLTACKNGGLSTEDVLSIFITGIRVGQIMKENEKVIVH